jgi:hypothetical protein
MIYCRSRADSALQLEGSPGADGPCGLQVALAETLRAACDGSENFFSKATRSDGAKSCPWNSATA